MIIHIPDDNNEYIVPKAEACNGPHVTIQMGNTRECLGAIDIDRLITILQCAKQKLRG